MRIRVGSVYCLRGEEAVHYSIYIYCSAYKIQYSICWLNYTAFKGLKGQKRKK